MKTSQLIDIDVIDARDMAGELDFPEWEFVSAELREWRDCFSHLGAIPDECANRLAEGRAEAKAKYETEIVRLTAEVCRMESERTLRTIERDGSRAEVARLTAELAANAAMLARQCDLARVAETEVARLTAELAKVAASRDAIWHGCACDPCQANKARAKREK